ncbi:restriction endonuclease subunit S [Methylophilus sp. DW102]|uniref:restriction endonuclease subunit S n=1 Tax=Methylophilus sp. DW102 TaxID=3095607 RepID=UPI0030D0124D
MYKDSGIEWLNTIPTHWTITPIKVLGQLKGGAGFPHDQQGVDDEELEFFKVNSLATANNDGTLTRAENTISRSTAKQLGAFIFPAHTITFAKVGAALLLGRVREIPSPACIDNNMMGLVVRDGNDTKFVRYAMELVCFDLIANPGAVPSLNEGQIGNFKLAKPPLCEQTAIVAFLDRETAKIDALIAEQEKLIALLAEKRQATISHAVTRGLNPNAPMKDSGVAWLGEVPAHWEVVGLTKYIESVVDYRGRTPTKVDAGIFLVTAKNIRDGAIDYEASQEYIAKNEYEDVMRRGQPALGDVLFTTEAPLGQVALIDREDIALAQRVIKFRANSKYLLNQYLKSWIMGSACQFNLELLATGSTALGIKGSKIGQVRICLPPLEEQTQIVSYIDLEVSRIACLKIEADKAINLLKERRSALITAAVTGQIDVRGLVESRPN